MQLVVVTLCALMVGAAHAQFQQYPGYRQFPNQYNQYQQQQQQYPYGQNPYSYPYARGAGAAVPILQYSNDVSPDGSFQYSYQTGDGIAAQAAGFTRNLGGPDGEAQVVQGSYSYTGPDGVVYQVNYVADENGYRAEGAHLPNPGAAAEVARNLNYYRGQPGVQVPVQVQPQVQALQVQQQQQPFPLRPYRRF